MKLVYYPETDSLYIDLSTKVSADSQEVAPGVVLDFDEKGQLVGLDIENASKTVDLTRLEAEELPVNSLSLSKPKMSRTMHRFLVVIEKADDNYSAYSPDLPGCIATGKTREDAECNIQEAIQLHVEGLTEDGLPIPDSESFAKYIETPLSTPTDNIDDAERNIQSQTLSEHREILRGIENLLNNFLTELKKSGGFTLKDDNELEGVWRILLAKSFNSLRWAYHLLQTGYYIQSLNLIRMAEEDWLACMDCEVNKDTIKFVLYGHGDWRSFTPNAMSGRLPQSLKDEWKGDSKTGEGTYGFLSTFAHPRHRSLEVMVSDVKNFLRVGPDYEKGLFLATLYYLLTSGRRLIEFLAKTTEPAWVEKELLNYIQEILSLEKKIGQEASMLLEAGISS